MMQSNQNQRTPQQDHHDNMKLGMLGLGIAALGIAKYELAIKAWFYDHMMALVFWGFLALVAIGLLIRWRIQKNNQEKIQRAQNLRAMKPTMNRNDFYRKGGPYGR
jgi:hypothetical protein